MEGVGREVLEAFWLVLAPFNTPAGEILEGRVPARPRLAGLLMPLSVRGTRFGKPSWFGDSGISNRGVDVPLVGGPHILGDRPFADCNSLVRFGNRRDVCSFKGEPAPILALDKLLRPAAEDLLPEKGDFAEGIVEASGAGAMEERLRWRGPSDRGVVPILSSRHLANISQQEVVGMLLCFSLPEID